MEDAKTLVAQSRARGKKSKTSRRDNALAILFWQVRAHGLPQLEAEILFHPARKWRIDFGYEKHKIGLEFQGGTFAIGKACPVCKRPPVGGHTRGKQYEGDCEKYAEASLHGWIVLQITENLITQGLVIDQLKRAYEIRTKAAT